jgi:chromosome segregation ATPase
MEFTEENFKALQAEVTTLQGKVKSLNDEAKGHRLSAEAFNKQADEFRTKFGDAVSASEDMKKAHASELEKLNLDYSAKLKDAETKGAAAKEAADKRVMMADLKVAAKDLGIIDLEYLKLLDTSSAKMDENGNVTNAAEMLEAFKTAKPHMFGDGKKPGVETGTTSNTKKAPPASSGDTKFDAMSATADEWKAALKSLK